MRNRVVVLFVAVLLGALPGAANAAVVPTPPPAAGHDLTLAELGERYGEHFTAELPPAGQTPEQRADWLLNQRAALGRTPMAWVRWAQDQAVAATSRTTARTTAPFAGVRVDPDLADGVLHLYRLVGLKPSAADRAAVAAGAARLSPNVRGALGQLVRSVVVAYAAQAPLVRTVTARVTAGWDPTKELLTVAERDAVIARQSLLLGALQEFRARTAADLAAIGGTSGGDPLFADPEGLVVLGNSTDDTYTRGGVIADPVLLVDPAGNDTYLNSAGGACPAPAALDNWLECNMLAVSVVADLGDGGTAPSNDSYLYDGPPAAVQGAGGPGGLGILVDVGGDDRYEATMTRGDWDPIFSYVDGGAQGYGYAGAGVLLDGIGDDFYLFDVASTTGASIWALGQGFGGGGGSGIAVDGDGSDWWLSHGLGMGTNARDGFQGIYVQGTGFYGGIGIAADFGQDRDWWWGEVTAKTVDYYAQGFGAFGGVGILYEDGGNDSYRATEVATDPWIEELLNCAFGTASLAGVGIMYDVAGDDEFYGASTSPDDAFVMDWGWGGPGVAYGLYIDTGGSDHYELEAFAGDGHTPAIEGWGYFHTGTSHPNLFGTFVDIGGTDTYIGAYPSVGNDKVWTLGVDRGV